MSETKVIETAVNPINKHKNLIIIQHYQFPL